MNTYYIRPWYPIARRIAEQVRAFPPDQYIVVQFYEYEGELETMDPRAVKPGHTTVDEAGAMVKAGEWLAEFDAEWEFRWPDSIGEPELCYPHPLEIIT